MIKVLFTDGWQSLLMKKLVATFLFCRDNSGATAIEYAFIAGLVSVAAVGAYGALADSMSNLYMAISSQVTNSM